MVDSHTKPLRIAFALYLASLFSGGCLSPSPLTPGDPDRELRAHLENWDARRSAGAARTDGKPGGELSNLAFRYPDHVPTLVAAAAAAYEGGSHMRAQKLLDQALRQEPGHPAGSLMRARMACNDGQLSLARRLLEESLMLRPDDPELHEALAGVQYLMNDLDEAEAELDMAQRLIGRGIDSWSISYHRGLLAEARGELDLALSHYNRAIELNPGHEPSQARARWLDVQ